jgi:hypothetical protein
LAERFLESLDDLEECESDRFWCEEAERRLAVYRNGSLGRGRRMMCSASDAYTLFFMYSSIRSMTKAS